MKASRGQGVADADRDVRQYLIRIAGTLGDLLGERLTGLYVYGSLASGTFQRDRDGLDLLGVVRRKLTAAEREQVARLLLRLSDERPMRGDIKVDVVTEHNARHFVHPGAFEVRYETSDHESIRRRRIDYNEERTNAQLAARVLDVRERGVTLVGPAPDAMFAPVPWHAYIGALESQLGKGDARIERLPEIAVLDSCRVLYGTTNPQMHAASNVEAAEFALRSVPHSFQSLVKDALAVYRGNKDADDVVFAEREVDAFREYVRERSGPAFRRAMDDDEDGSEQ